MSKTEEFLRKINKAIAEVDDQFLLNNVTDDFCWKIVGERTISGKSEFSEALEQMREMPLMKIDIRNVIIEDGSGIVEGIVVGRNRIGQKKYFGFCDVYSLEGTGEELKISKMNSYVIDVSRHKRYKESC